MFEIPRIPLVSRKRYNKVEDELQQSRQRRAELETKYYALEFELTARKLGFRVDTETKVIKSKRQSFNAIYVKLMDLFDLHGAIFLETPMMALDRWTYKMVNGWKLVMGKRTYDGDIKLSKVRINVKTPECDKAVKIRNKSQSIGEFIEWLRDEKKVILASKMPIEDFEDEEIETLAPAYYNLDSLLAEFFGIDLNKIEKEKRELLEAVRKANAQ